VSTVGRVAEDGGGRPLRDPVAVGSAPYAAFRRPRSRDHGDFPRGDKLSMFNAATAVNGDTVFIFADTGLQFAASAPRRWTLCPR